ncbi:oig-3, partial [Pristionchus pacificus]
LLQPPPSSLSLIFSFSSTDGTVLTRLQRMNRHSSYSGYSEYNLHEGYDRQPSRGSYHSSPPHQFSPPPPQQFSPHSNHGGSMLNVDVTDGLFRPIPQRSPLTKQVNQLAYEIPKNKYATNPWNYAPEFLKVFGDVRTHVGGKAVFDCLLLGSPRPKVCWLFNDEKCPFTDIQIEDTSDVCRLVIPYVQPHHYGTYTVLCENEIGRAVSTATLSPL